MSDDAKIIGLAEFIRLFTLPGEPEEPVTLEGKTWNVELGREVPSGEMMTWTPKHPPRPRRQIVLGVNPPPIEEVEVRTAWDRDQKRCVFVTHHSREELEPEFVVDERGVRSLLPDVAEMEALHLSEEEKLGILEEIKAVNLTWPVSLNEVRAWAERMDYAMAGQADVDDRKGKRKPGPRQSPAMKNAIDMASRLIADGKPKEVANWEAAEEFGVKQNSLAREVRRRLNGA